MCSVLGMLTIFAATFDLSAQTALPHAFANISQLPEGGVSLTLTGRVSSTFRQYFDIYPIEVSSDLANWKPLVVLFRTNASTDALLYRETQSSENQGRFYAMVTNQLITPFLKPTGPFPVGKTSFLLSNPSRTNRYNVRTNSSFMVSCWYPAAPKAGELPGPWEDKALAQDPNWWGGYNDRVLRFVTHSLPGASIATNQEKYPVIIYVPGYSGPRAENQEKFEDLASHGYMVFSADHWEVYGTVFPDGRYLRGSSQTGEPSTMLTDPVFAAKALTRRIEDVGLILADLDRGSSSISGLGSHADTNNIGFIGFSFGAGVAGEMCRTNERCRAVVILDGAGQGAGELVRLGLQKPYLMMTVASNSGLSAFFDKAAPGAVWFLLSNIEHASFVYGYEKIDPIPAKRDLQRTMKTYILSFFNKFLKNEDDHLLDGPSTNFPRVIAFQKK